MPRTITTQEIKEWLEIEISQMEDFVSRRDYVNSSSYYRGYLSGLREILGHINISSEDKKKSADNQEKRMEKE